MTHQTGDIGSSTRRRFLAGLSGLMVSVASSIRARAVTRQPTPLTGDGQQFLFVTSADDAGVPPFTVVLNWMAEMKK